MTSQVIIVQYIEDLTTRTIKFTIIYNEVEIVGCTHDNTNILFMLIFVSTSTVQDLLF